MTPDMYKDIIRHLRKSLKFHRITNAVLVVMLTASIITISLLTK